MRCPVCSEELERVMHDGVQTFACAACRGGSVNAAVLRKWTARSEMQVLWRRIFDAAVPGARLCPSCSNPMAAVAHRTSSGPLELDGCRACHLIWFDASELEAFAPGIGSSQARRAAIAQAASDVSRGVRDRRLERSRAGGTWSGPSGEEQRDPWLVASEIAGDAIRAVLTAIDVLLCVI